MKENSKIINEISHKFYEMRVKYGIGYVLKNSEEIVKNNCSYNLDNKEYLDCYNVAFKKFRGKYEPRYLKELENKTFQTLEGYKGTYGLNYVLNNLDIIKNKILKEEVNSPKVKSSYEKVLLKFKSKYQKEIYGNNLPKEKKKTIFGLSPFKAFLAIFMGFLDGLNKRK